MPTSNCQLNVEHSVFPHGTTWEFHSRHPASRYL